MSELLSELKIIIEDRTAYCGRAVVRALVNTGPTSLCEMTLNEDWLSTDLFNAPGGEPDLTETFQRFTESWQTQQRILPEFKLHIADMQIFFSQLRCWTTQLELGFASAPENERAELRHQTTKKVASRVLPSIDGLFEKFEGLASNLEERLKPSHRAYMKQQLHSWVLCSPFAYRTFAKPLGYAGDYEMVNMIARNGYEGDSLYAQVVNCWFLSQSPAVAHRNRISHLTQKIVEETILRRSQGRHLRVLNLACGPALEVQAFLRDFKISEGLEVSLLDFNQETIEHVSAVMDGLKRKHARNISVHLIKKSVLQILKEGGKTDASKTLERVAGHYDLVYCAGLFDYLPDSVCQRLMNIMYRWLAPGGLLLATNVDHCNPLRQGMDYLLDWNLVYRTAQQSRTLKPSGAPEEGTFVTSDNTGVNLFIEVRKPSHG
jgi:extracellular factor (EF) 3-hydroxypalmitic acid methyl ester biosynthesis protein